MKCFIISVLLICAFLLECGTKGYKIIGNVEGIEDGTYIYLTIVGPPNKIIDSVQIQNYIFTFTGGDTPEPIWATLNLKGRFSSVASVYLENGEIRVSGDSYNSKAMGTYTNDAQVVFDSLVSPYYTKLSGLSTQIAVYISEKPDTVRYIREEFEKTQEILNEKEWEYIRLYNDTPIAVKTLEYKSRSLTGREILDGIELLDKSVQDSPAVLNMKERAFKLMKTEIGVIAPDFDLDIDNKLSDYRGNYVLLDFWASWCAPCRAEMPNVSAMAKKYNDKNFKVIGISLDKDLSLWKKAIEEEKSDWLHICDDKGVVANEYAILSIPHTVLIDPDGKIIAKDLRKDNLREKLAEIFDSE